jgi:hypothetical protein
MIQFKKLSILFLLVVIFTMTIGACIASNNSNGGRKHLVVDNKKLVVLPKNVSVEKFDINSDGFDDAVVTYPWENSELYLNYGSDRYYSIIQSNARLQVGSTKNNGWLNISFNYVDMNWARDASTLIGDKLFQPAFLPFEAENDNQKDSSIIKYDGSSYKLPYKYCKGLKIYAPRYQFESKIQISEKNKDQEVDIIYLDLAHIKIKIDADQQSEYSFGKIFFTDLNRDGALDAVLYYCDRNGSGAEAYAGMLLNDGDNCFIYAGDVELGYSGIDFNRFKSEVININGIRFTAIVSKGPILRPGEKKFTPASSMEIYLYQSKLKQFIRITAMPGRDKSTFIPLDKKKFEDIVNPPLFRNAPVNPGNSTKAVKVDEPAISTLIDNYEKSLVNAINSNNFSLVAKYLTPGSNLYKSQKDLVAKLYPKKTQEKLVGYKVEKIKSTEQANVYQVYVTEKIGIKRSGKANFVVSKFHWVYTVVADGVKYSLSEIAKWDGK